MKFSEFCDMAENTEKEAQLFQYFKDSEFFNESGEVTLKGAAAKLKSIPLLGKILAAVIALAESESIAEFRQTEHYGYIKNWNLSFDPDGESEHFALSPSSEQIQKIVKIIAIASTVITLLLLCRKFCRRKKEA